MKPYLSVIIDPKDACASLPLTLIDLDNYFYKINLEYEVLILSADETHDKQIAPVVNKFKKIIKRIKVLRIAPKTENLPKVSGSVVLFIKSGLLPVEESLRSIISALDPKERKQVFELVFGSYKSAGLRSKLLNLLGKCIRLPVELGADRLVIGFNKNISSSIFNLKSFGSETFDIDLAMLSDKMRYKIMEAPLLFREDEPVNIGYVNKFNLIGHILKARFMSLASYGDERKISRVQVSKF